MPINGGTRCPPLTQYLNCTYGAFDLDPRWSEFFDPTIYFWFNSVRLDLQGD